jgi:hypothetical protein
MERHARWASSGSCGKKKTIGKKEKIRRGKPRFCELDFTTEPRGKNDLGKGVEVVNKE